MNWVAIDELSSKLPIPDGYRIEQLKRSEIPEVIRCFRDWFPDITVGAESCYQREDFYSREVSLEGEPERDVIVLLVKKDQELVAIVSLQRFEDTLTLYGRLGVIAPRYRGEKLAYMGPALLEAVGRAMGMEVIYLLAEFTIPNMQRVMERAGFQIVGIIPASDRLLVAPGVTKRVYEAYYVKVLAADAEILRPQVESMTPRTKALYDFLFAA
jgi:RimJ/RimL family protein N-acetyltransferase